ncbi:MAG: HEAT repeat domain-containing protein [Verrucomicrobiota bacterium]
MKKHLLFLFVLGLASVAHAIEIDQTIELLGSDDYNEQTKARSELKFAFADAKGSDHLQIQTKVIDNLNGSLPLDQRLYLLRLLEWFGDDQAVEAVSPLLNDSDTAVQDSARRVLMSIPGNAAAFALGNGLRSATSGEDKANYIDALGYRKEARAVPLINQYLETGDATVTRSAANALVSIGSTEAIPALLAARGSAGEAKVDVELAILSIGADAKTANELAANSTDPAVRVEAYETLVVKDPAAADKILAKLLATEAAPARSQMINIAMVKGNAQLQKRLVDYLPKASKADQILIVAAIGEAGLSQYEGAVLAVLANSGDWFQKNVTIDALGNIGSDASFEPMYNALINDSKNKVILDAVARLNASSADTKAMATARDASVDPAERISAMKILSLRNSPGALEYLNEVVADPNADRKVREAAIKTLEDLGNFESVEIFVTLIGNSDPLMRSAQRSLKRLSLNLRAPNALWDGYYQPAIAKASDPAIQERFVVILDSVDSKKTLDYLKQQILDPNSPLKDASLKAMSRWSSVKSVDVWIDIANKSDEMAPTAVKEIKRAVTSSQVKAGPVEKVNAMVRAVQKAPNAEFKLQVLEAFVDTPGNMRWALTHLDKIKDDPDVTAKVQEIRDKNS